MNQPPFKLDFDSAIVVLSAIKEVCSNRSWLIVEAEVLPEKVMNDFKSYASRALNRRDANEKDRRR